MRDISKNNHYSLNFDSSINGELILNDGDSIDFPVDFSFDEAIYDEKLNYIKKLIAEGYIKCTHGAFNISFNLYKTRPRNYNEWQFLIKYAKENNIQFMLNAKIEYSPREMKNYIEQFTKVDNAGNKQLIFEGIRKKLPNNPITLKNTDTMIHNPLDKVLIVDSKITRTINNYLSRDIAKNIMGLCIGEGKKFDKEHLKYCKEAIDYLNTNWSNRKLDIYIYSKYQYFETSEFKLLLELEKYIRKNYDSNYELKFHSGDNILSKTQILNANNKISSVVSYLKKSKLSPYEKILYVHKLLTEKDYYNEPDKSQDLYASLNSRTMVCLGYSLLFNAIFKELDDPNIKTSISLYDVNAPIKDNVRELHASNNVYLKDSKYDIEGYYDLDLTTGSSTSLLNNFMMPPGDIINTPFTKKINTVEYDAQELMLIKRCIYFIKRDLEDPSQIKIGLRDNIIANTLEHLNTKMGKKALENAKKKWKGSRAYYLYAAINECIEQTTIISIDKTKLALENVAMKVYGMNKEESNHYSTNILLESIFEAILVNDRKLCNNDFARKSLDIEQGKIILSEQNIDKKKNYVFFKK